MKYLGFISYNGGAYEGFQRQKNKPTIQGTVEEQLSLLCGETTLIHGVGRTDAGVHALKSAFSFESKNKLNEKKAVVALNRLLPKDIRVLGLFEVEPSFDARHSCVGKTYEYRLSYDRINPFLIGLEAQMERPDFDVDLFEEAILVFKGHHDFKNFTTKKEDKDDFIRTIDSIEVKKGEGRVVVIFSGNGFMTYQIRLMVGAAIKVATHKFTVEELREKLEASPRHIVPFKAPAEGLYLKEVDYGKSFPL